MWWPYPWLFPLVLIFIAVLEPSVEYNQQLGSYGPRCSLRETFNYSTYNTSTWLVLEFTVDAILTWTELKSPTQMWSLIITATFLCSHLSAIPDYWSNAMWTTRPGMFTILTLNGLMVIRPTSNQVLVTAELLVNKVEALLCCRKRKSVLLLENVSTSLVLLSVTRLTCTLMIVVITIFRLK